MTARSGRPRVLVHAAAIPVGGGATYLEVVVPQLGAALTGRGADVTVLVAPGAAGLLGPEVRAEEVSWARRGPLGRLVFDQVVLPWRVARRGVDVLLCLASHSPLRPAARQVVLVRNAIYFDPEILARTTRWRRVRWPMEGRLILAGAARGDVVVYPTRAMRDLAERRAGSGRRGRALRDRGLVSGYGVDPSFADRPPVPVERAAPPTFLVPASATVQKNLGLVVRAVAATAEAGAEVCAEITIDAHALPPELADVVASERLVERGYLRFLGPVSRAEVRERLGRADGCVVVSWNESFGHPAAEAIAAGCPVIASDRPWAREVCGPFAAYVDPADPVALAVLWRSWPDGAPRVASASEARARFDWSHHVADLVAAVLGPGPGSPPRPGPATKVRGGER